MKRVIGVAILLGLAAQAPLSAQDHATDDHGTSHADQAHHEQHFVEAFYTLNAFPQSKVRPDVALYSADGLSVYSTNIEVEWMFGPNFSASAFVPLHHMRVTALGNETGFGDVVVGGKFVPVIQDNLILAFGSEALLPTGSEPRGLGHGHAELRPFVRGWIPMGAWAIQAATDVVIPFESAADMHLAVNTAISWTSPSGFSPLVEGITEYNLEHSHTEFSVAPGFRWAFQAGWAIGAAFRIPVSGADEDYRLIGGFVRHFN